MRKENISIVPPAALFGAQTVQDEVPSGDVRIPNSILQHRNDMVSALQELATADSEVAALISSRLVATLAVLDRFPKIQAILRLNEWDRKQMSRGNITVEMRGRLLGFLQNPVFDKLGSNA